MVWLLGRVVRDRPGILSEIASILRSRGVNIRNVVGNSQALMLEVGGGVDLGIIDEIRKVGDIEFTATLNVQAQPLVFPREFFMEALSNALSQIGVDVKAVFRRVCHELGRRVAESLNLSSEQGIYMGLLVASAFNRFRLVEFKPLGDEVQLVIAEPFDEGIELSCTLGFIQGLANEAFKGLYSITYRRVGVGYVIMLRRV
jgi:predicted amino acid-binding ACT domain protein